MARKKKEGAERKAALVEIGAKLVSKYGQDNVTRRMVAKENGCSEALVSRYCGTTEEAQKLYARHARKLKLPIPTKAEADALGTKLRKHKPGDKRDTRKRSPREVKAIRNREIKPASKPASKVPGKKRVAKMPTPTNKPVAPGPTERKTAARKPKAAPPVTVGLAIPS